MADYNDVDKDNFHRRIGTGGANKAMDVITRGRTRFTVRAEEPAIEGRPVEAIPTATTIAGSGVFFFRDNGAGKSQLCVRFPSGATQILGTEP